jgi:UDP-glucose 4-epimerase
VGANRNASIAAQSCFRHWCSILGNGRQRKSYLYVQDFIDAILYAVEHARDKINVLNLGTNEYCEVNDSIGWITGFLGHDPVRSYSGGKRGWIGDNPFIFLDISRIRALGWQPKLTIREAVERTIAWLAENRWVFDARQ